MSNGDGGGKENNQGNGGKDKVSVLSVYSEPTTDLPVTTDDSASGASELDSLLTTTDEEPTADITTDLVKENPFRYPGMLYYYSRKKVQEVPDTQYETENEISKSSLWDRIKDALDIRIPSQNQPFPGMKPGLDNSLEETAEGLYQYLFLPFQ